ncbi:MAG TPA: hypothetical protein VGA22_02900 [Gemmatimonadales bacterium]|jgi:hypothetical protein
MAGKLSIEQLPGLLVAVSLVAVASVQGQTRQPLRDDRTARPVEVHHLATLRFQDVAAFAPDVLTQVVRLPGSGWGAISYSFGGSIALFSATGAPTGMLGRLGSGPGELKQARFAIGLEKQLWVIDNGNNRLIAFASNGSLIGDRRLPGSTIVWAQPSADGTGLLLSGYFPNHHAVALVTMNAADDRFGGDLGTSPNAYVEQHVAAETPSGEVWAVARAGGNVEILGADNLETLASTQLPEDVSYPVNRPGPVDVSRERPAPEVLGVMVDADGILWIATYAADAHWRPGASPRDGVDRVFDTLLLAVSTPDRTIVGAQRLDRVCLAIVDGLISCTNEEAQTIDISRLSLKR